MSSNTFECVLPYHCDKFRKEQGYGTRFRELFVLYGRRRVGKTELLTQFCRDKRHIFFVADLDVEPVLHTALSTAVNADPSPAGDVPSVGQSGSQAGRLPGLAYPWRCAPRSVVGRSPRLLRLRSGQA